MTPSNFLPAPTGPHGRAVPAEYHPRNKNARSLIHRAIIRNIKTLSQQIAPVTGAERIYHTIWKIGGGNLGKQLGVLKLDDLEAFTAEKT